MSDVKQLKVKVTDSELAAIKAGASAAGKSLSQFVRDSLLAASQAAQDRPLHVTRIDQHGGPRERAGRPPKTGDESAR